MNSAADNKLIGRFTKNARKALYYNTYIQMEDNNKVIVENCKHIIECNDIMVKLITYDYDITVWGTQLTVSGYNSQYIIINGKVSSVEIFPRRSDRK